MADDVTARGRVRQAWSRWRRGADTPSAPPAAPVVERPTRLGPALDDAVSRARSRMMPPGADSDYDLAREHFDIAHFFLQARGLAEDDRIDPLRHFLRNGPDAKASPEINFDMRSYLQRHPERRDGTGRSPWLAWLEEGRAQGEIADPAPGLAEISRVLDTDPHELADALVRTRSDLQERLRHGTLGQMFAQAVEVEPLIGEAWSETARPVIPPMDSPTIAGQVAALHQCHDQAGFATARLVLVVKRPRWGGGRRMEGHLAHALAPVVGADRIVVVYTDDTGTTPPDRFPAGVREVDLATAVGDLEAEPAQRVLVELVRSFRADAVVVVNSDLMYAALATYGRALRASERVFLMLFCNEQLALGNWVGLPLRQVYRNFDQVAGVLTDSEYLAGWLRDRHQLGEEDGAKIQALRAPVDATLPESTAPTPAAGRRPQVFWAGRWDRQKRVDVLMEIASRMPDVDFRVWGETVMPGGRRGAAPANVALEGRYGHISEVALDDADAWLYTSAWDGVPSQLLEVGMTGVPLVGSLVGGTGEVLSPEDAWPVTEPEDPAAYVAALREVLTDPVGARRRSHALRERLLRERSATDFAAHVAQVLLVDGGGEDS
ncbi:glycosyltransferase family 4 protein [Nocardioides coralli]|uniref:glycosyltransferase family 4 protein n=1 Tax=Nocardioides coralli TaxID=2872154 RepID=UPI001CA42807|nr:glycosyltransferase family 4 protein [Nocardioides coralli]QZY28154.1 glycosyltransferase family 4 protein [Nocardioides coralli]